MKNEMKFTLPLIMYGVNGYEWHRKGLPVLHRPVVGKEPFKSGKRKGQLRKVRSKEWIPKTRSVNAVVGYDPTCPYTRGKRKGEPREIIEKVDKPVMSTGWFPTVNHIYVQMGGGASRRLKQIAEEKLQEWRGIARRAADEQGFSTIKSPHKAHVYLFFYLPTNGAGDTHNVKKLLLDALEGVVHENDFYMLDNTIDFEYDDDNPRIEVHTWGIE
jgi:Endodeoxyribonuclease RusA